ncbi:MAG: RagB/SusD family nutrient uptake outer membrane protein, partial [Pseudopedobacter saltans]
NQFVPGTFDLYKESDANGFNPYLSCRNVLLNNWNKEVIFVRPSASVNNMQYDRTPYHNGYASGVKASGALGATQVMVDAFSMANGKLISDPSSGYVTTGYSSFKAPGDDQARNIFNQWVNREPRFYVNITYDGSKWLNTSTSGTVITQLYAHGNSGAAVNNEASRTGYIVRKNVGTSDWNSGGIINVQYRLANIFLDYVEALNESDPGNADILNYLNQIRARAGVPEYGSGLPAPSSQTEMRQAIRHERQVELCFENVRYFDTRRWKIAEQTDNGVFYGLNINADLPDFLKQVPFETRVFTKRDYLFPIPQYDINNDPNLVQNTGWGK